MVDDDELGCRGRGLGLLAVAAVEERTLAADAVTHEDIVLQDEGLMHRYGRTEDLFNTSRWFNRDDIPARLFSTGFIMLQPSMMASNPCIRSTSMGRS